MNSQWVAVEHYRIHTMEDWPDGPVKDAGLAAARASLSALESSSTLREWFVCDICSNRPKSEALESAN